MDSEESNTSPFVIKRAKMREDYFTSVRQRSREQPTEPGVKIRYSHNIDDLIRGEKGKRSN
jgi:hypothetical protein